MTPFSLNFPGIKDDPRKWAPTRKNRESIRVVVIQNNVFPKPKKIRFADRDCSVHVNDGADISVNVNDSGRAGVDGNVNVIVNTQVSVNVNLYVSATINVTFRKRLKRSS